MCDLIYWTSKIVLRTPRSKSPFVRHLQEREANTNRKRGGPHLQEGKRPTPTGREEANTDRKGRGQHQQEEMRPTPTLRE